MANLLKRQHDCPDYRHKKFDVSKRLRLDSTTSSMEVDVCSINDGTPDNKPIQDPVSDQSQKHVSLKRSYPFEDTNGDIREDSSHYPLKKRMCFSITNNDSGVCETTQCSTPLTPQPRSTATPRIPEAKKISVVTPSLKRRFPASHHTNDSGVSLIHSHTDDDYDDIMSAASPARLTPLHPRYTSTPLSVLPDNTDTISPSKRRRVMSNASSISALPPHIIAESSRNNCRKSNLLFASDTIPDAWQPRHTSTPLNALAAVASTMAPAIDPIPTPLPFLTAQVTAKPTAISMPKISDEVMSSICRYHENMVRKFPKKERSPKDQERRDKNTIACRVSRRLKKLESVAVEEQYKELSRQHFEIVEASVRATAYLNALTLRLAAVGASRWKYQEAAAGAAPAVTQHLQQTVVEVKPKTISTNASGLRPAKSFSIAFLTGQDGKK